MIKLIKTTFYNEPDTKQKLVKFIESADILSMSGQCREFESSFSKVQKRKYSVFVSSGSMANLVLLQSLVNLGVLNKGQSVGVSAATWATNVMPIIQLNLKPVALDCEIENLNVSGRILEEHIKKQKLDALFLTNTLGFCADLQKIAKICKKKNILLIEDNCESLGSKVNGRLLGNFGLASTFSFFVGHHFSTIEGGMICTDSKELYEMALIVRAHGWDRNLPENSKAKLRRKFKISDFYAKYTFYDLAYNARPTEIQGYLGNIQLKFLPEIIKKREENFIKYNNIIKANPEFYPLNLGHMDVISNFAMTLVCKSKKIWEKYKSKFEKANVEIRPIIAGDITRQPFYKKYVKEKVNCQNAAKVHDLGFYFPNNPELTNEEVDKICKLLGR